MLIQLKIVILKNSRKSYEIAKSLANLASLGKGPRIYRRGRTIFYKFDEIERLFTPEAG